MKKNIFILATAIILLFINCAAGQTTSSGKGVSGKYAKLPPWALDPNVEGGIGAVGISKIGQAGLSFAKNDAVSQARDELSKTMSVSVKNMIKNFTQEIGVGDDQTVDRVAQQVSKQLSANFINNSVQKNSFVLEDTNEVFVHIVIDEKKYVSEVKKQANSSLKNEKALYQQIIAKKGQDDMEAEFQKEAEKSANDMKKLSVEIQEKKAAAE